MSEASIAPEQLRQIIEAILVTAEAPVTPGRLLALFDGLNGRDIREAIDALKSHYDEAGHAFTIAEVAGGFQLATRQDCGPWLRKFHDRRQVRLSQAALETLAIVAFKQPVTRAELEAVRGVDSGGVLHTLLELNLIRMAGRSEAIGKPMLFGTTREFLVHFGLKGLADLPRPREIEELLGERWAQQQGEDGPQAAAPPQLETVHEAEDEARPDTPQEGPS